MNYKKKTFRLRESIHFTSLAISISLVKTMLPIRNLETFRLRETWNSQYLTIGSMKSFIPSYSATQDIYILNHINLLIFYK